MKGIGWIIGLIFLTGVMFASCVALMNEDEGSLGHVQLVYHDGGYEDGRCYEGECDGYNSGGDYGHNRRDDRNRNRGAFSPGPFDRSPVDFSNSCISLDCSGREKGRDDRGRDQEPSDDYRSASLFPFPTPGGVQKFVMSTIEAGIGLGRLFANATIDFVSSIMVGIA